MKKTALAFALAAVAAGCASSRSHESGPKVSDADLGRLSPDQMAIVDQARQAAATAHDELARARLREQQVQQEVSLAKADRTAADADAQRAAAEAKIANESREPTALQRAQQLQQQASLHKQAADAHLEWANKVTDARKAQVTSAQKQVDLADAQLEWAKLRALQAANIPAASKYDAGKFQQAVDDARKAWDQAFAKSRDADTQAITAQRHYEDLNRQLQAYMGGRTG